MTEDVQEAVDLLQPAAQEVPAPVESPKQEDDREINFRALREKAERLERERDEERRKYMEMQEELIRKLTPSNKEPEPVEEEISPGDWLTFEQYQRKTAKIAEEAARRAVEEERERRRREEAPTRIKSMYQDFDSVVTKENVLALNEREPEVAKALALIQDEEAKAIAAYKYIKTLVPNIQSSASAQTRMAKNDNVPKSMSAVGGSAPLAAASMFEKGLTPELRQRLYQDMMNAARGG